MVEDFALQQKASRNSDFMHQSPKFLLVLTFLKCKGKLGLWNLQRSSKLMNLFCEAHAPSPVEE
jgi:hypothetical protein